MRDALARSHERLMANMPGVIEGSDPEAVHQARVASRRLRSDLSTFKPFLYDQWEMELRGDIRDKLRRAPHDLDEPIGGVPGRESLSGSSTKTY